MLLDTRDVRGVRILRTVGVHGVRIACTQRPRLNQRSAVMGTNRLGANTADVVVVGAGHNGLTAACYLAKAGHNVLVVEASPTVGGMTSTYATIPGAPHHLVNEGAVQASLYRATTIEADLQLSKYGLRQVVADPQHLHLGPDGESLAIWRDANRTADELRRFSKKDAKAWLEMAE